MSQQPTVDYFELQKQRKAKRMYQRMLTGLQIAHNFSREMRFLTLTTSNNRVLIKSGAHKGEPRELKSSYDLLRKRIKRATVEKDGFQGFNMNKYICLRTTEGNGVLHIVFWGGLYIPIQWLKRVWEQIHGAYQVNIQYVHNLKSTTNKLVGYLLDRYLLNQPVERMSYGWGWAWLGFCKSWNNVKYIYWTQGLKRGKGEFREQSNYGNYSFKESKDRTQSIPFWRGVLWNPPKTSRKTSFWTPNRGYNAKYF